MKTLFKNILSGLIIGLTAFGVIYASLSSVQPGETLTADKWNEIIGEIEALKNQNSTLNSITPSGLVASFNLSTCPNGWLPANGSGSIAGENIPDLRGKFIRGLNSFENGENKLTGTGSDIDGVDRVLGSPQKDAIRNITGGVSSSRLLSGEENVGAIFLSDKNENYKFTVTHDTGNGYYARNIYFDASRIVPTGSDNRPQNIALIYCVKA